MESSLIHPTERSYFHFLSFWIEELKKLVQNRDKKNGVFSKHFMEANGINLILSNLIQRRKLPNLIMKISLTNTFLKAWTLKVKNSKI